MNMELLVLIILLPLALLLLGNWNRKSIYKARSVKPAESRGSVTRSMRETPPSSQLAEADSPAAGLAARLQTALPYDYKESIKFRMLKEHPQLTDHEFEWRYLELQRFFILCAVMDRVPMFSKVVDELWHEMLMFTQEYQRFSERYIGRMLHHRPNTKEHEPNQGERAWFDLVYVELFGWSPESAQIWGPFFKQPIPREQLEPYRFNSSSLPEDGRFNPWTYERLPEARKAIDTVRERLHERLMNANNQQNAPLHANYAQPEMLLASVIFFSWNHPDDFSSQLMPEEELKKKDDSSAAYCGSAYNSNSDDRRGDFGEHSGNDNSPSSSDSGSSGGDSGGSSCSSCGGGCSS